MHLFLHSPNTQPLASALSSTCWLKRIVYAHSRVLSLPFAHIHALTRTNVSERVSERKPIIITTGENYFSFSRKTCFESLIKVDLFPSCAYGVTCVVHSTAVYVKTYILGILAHFKALSMLLLRFFNVSLTFLSMLFLYPFLVFRVYEIFFS